MHVRRGARRTRRWARPLGVASVAYQDMPSFVVSDRHIAVAALDHVPAARAEDERVIAPPVEQQDHLPLFPERAGASPAERFAPPAQRSPSRGRRSITSTAGIGLSSTRLGMHQPCVLSQLGISPAFQRRRGRAQEHRHAFELRPLDGHVAGVIARRCLLLERALVLFIDDDQPQSPRRRKDRRAGAHDHLHLARARSAASADAARRRSSGCAARPPTKPPRNRRIVCGVRLISGTSTIAWRPLATTRSIA